LKYAEGGVGGGDFGFEGFDCVLAFREGARPNDKLVGRGSRVEGFDDFVAQAGVGCTSLT
jgi:hypothetical protein